MIRQTTTRRELLDVAQTANTNNGVGAVYTPPGLAEWAAIQLLRFVPKGSPLRILDPACGDGELLAKVAQVSRETVELCGRDIDADAIRVAAARFTPKTDFAEADSLLPLSLTALKPQPHAVITNPPWGRPDPEYRRQLQALGYELAEGQFDLYEVFVERLVKSFPNLPMAFILPDSLLLPEHTKLRRFLLRNTEILLLARLGEGLFPGVYRGTVVVVLRSSPVTTGDVECFRLQPGERRAFLTERASLEVIRKARSHKVPRRRFASNPNAEFTLDIRADEHAVDKMLAAAGGHWGRLFMIGRGIEIGKSGHALRCQRCGHYRPVAKGSGPTSCRNCGQEFSSDVPLERVVRPRSVSLDSAWAPVIVGEDVQRYYCEPSREIRVELPGIRYKSSALLAKPKLVVRKTGVGIRSAVDRSGSLTIQTVYHFVPRAEHLSLMLDYWAGVLNSRVMLAFHLRWSGESEWRSHPYVTPTALKTLPVPNPVKEDKRLSSAAHEIALLARRRSCGDMVEGEIETLVETLYGFNARDRQWVRQVIGSAQSLRGISDMRTTAMSA